MANILVLKLWAWMFVISMGAMLLLPLFGCSPVGFPDLSKSAGFAAPADFTKGVGETKFLQSSDGKTVFWETPYFNDTNTGAWYSVFPSITIKDDKGKILWTGKDQKDWYAAPGKQGHVGGKIIIPDGAIQPAEKWEQGATPSAGWSGQPATK